jgi:hypothetical protein
MNEPTPQQMERLREIAKDFNDTIWFDKNIFKSLLTVWREAHEVAIKANTSLGHQIVNLTHQVTYLEDQKERVKEVNKGVWAAHEKQFAEQAEKIHQLQSSLRLAVEALDRCNEDINSNIIRGYTIQSTRETLSTIRANHPQLMEEKK